MLLGLTVYALYLCAGWVALVQGIKYTPAAMRRETAVNGVGDSLGDRGFAVILVIAYLFVLHVWPVAVGRKIASGRVVGK